jgi:hypothetical protein
MQNRKNLVIVLIFSLVCSFTIINCSDEPNAVGIGQLQGSDFVNVRSFDSYKDSAIVTGSSFKRHVSVGLSPFLLVGKYQGGKYPGYEARTLIKFSTIPDSLANATVVSSKITLQPSHYTLGDSSADLSFSAFKITQQWSASTVTWDSITSSSFDPAPKANFSGSVNDTTAIAFDLDPTLVKEWLINAADTMKHSLLQGLILMGTTNSAVRTFNSFQSQVVPQLEVAYTKDSRSDTLRLYSGEATFIADVNLPPDPQGLYLQSGVAYRAQVKFDVSKIPSRVVLNNAIMEIALNRAASTLSYQYTDSLFLQFRNDISTDSTEATIVIGKRLDNTKDVYTFTGQALTSMVQRWVNGTFNNGVVLKALSELRNLDLFTINAPTVADSTVPRLKVTYMTLPAKAAIGR